MKYLKHVLLPFKHASNSCHLNLLNSKCNTMDDYLYQIISVVRSENKYLELIPNFEKVIHTTTNHNSRVKIPDIISTMLTSYKILEKTENITEASVHQALVLAWVAKMADSYSKLINTHKHHKNSEKKSQVSEDVRDADLLRSFMYIMLEQKFQDTKWYRDILHHFNKAFICSRISQYLEQSYKNERNKYANLNINHYKKLCDFKVSYPYFQLPLFLAMTLANKCDQELLQSTGRICSDMGMLYQIKADFENCFGTDAMTELEGRDIQKGKCTWLAVTALQRFTPRQRLVFEACYGSDEPAHIERVKLLYEQTQLPSLYREKEGALCDSVMQQAESLEKSGIPYKLFEELLETIRAQ